MKKVSIIRRSFLVCKNVHFLSSWIVIDFLFSGSSSSAAILSDKVKVCATVKVSQSLILIYDNFQFKNPLATRFGELKVPCQTRISTQLIKNYFLWRGIIKFSDLRRKMLRKKTFSQEKWSFCHCRRKIFVCRQRNFCSIFPSPRIVGSRFLCLMTNDTKYYIRKACFIWKQQVIRINHIELYASLLQMSVEFLHKSKMMLNKLW